MNRHLAEYRAIPWAKLRHVYVMRAVTGNIYGPYKIGMTGDLPRRLREVELWRGGPMEVMFAERFFDARGAERTLHRHFREHNFALEWFALGPMHLREIPDLLRPFREETAALLIDSSPMYTAWAAKEAKA